MTLNLGRGSVAVRNCMPPLHFSDEELSAFLRAAKPIRHRDRAAALDGKAAICAARWRRCSGVIFAAKPRHGASGAVLTLPHFQRHDLKALSHLPDKEFGRSPDGGTFNRSTNAIVSA
jgi:hypothetical protein